MTLTDYSEHCKVNEGTVSNMLTLAKNYKKVTLLTVILSIGA